MYAKMRIFPKFAYGVLALFSGIMVMVTIVAYSRQSGSTRQDMVQAQQVRQEAMKRTAGDTPSSETAQR